MILNKALSQRHYSAVVGSDYPGSCCNNSGQSQRTKYSLSLPPSNRKRSPHLSARYHEPRSRKQWLISLFLSWQFIYCGSRWSSSAPFGPAAGRSGQPCTSSHSSGESRWSSAHGPARSPSRKITLKPRPASLPTRVASSFTTSTPSSIPISQPGSSPAPESSSAPSTSSSTAGDGEAHALFTRRSDLRTDRSHHRAGHTCRPAP